MSVTSDYLHDAGVPPRFHESSLDAFHPTRSSGGLKALAWARSIAAEAHSGLLCGDVGTGKTHLVVGILAARHAAWLEKYPQANIDVKDDRGRVVGVRGRPNLSDAFVDVPAMLDRMRSWIAHPDGPDPIWDLKRADLLVLDDLGRERVTDWASERLYVIVDYRYGQRLPTIATSNLKPSELVSGDYGPIVSRLLDGSQAIWLGGKDQRAA
jgi:DNA replication protein DnaC